MEVKRHTVRILAGAISVACIGLIAVQVRLLMNTAELKRTIFDQTVTTALTQAATAIDHLSVADRLFFVQDSLGGLRHPASWAERGADSVMQVSVLSTDSGTVTTRMAKGVLAYSVDRPLSLSVESFDARGRLDTVLVREQVVESGGSVRIPDARATGYLRLRTKDGVSTFRMQGGVPRTTISVGQQDTVAREVMVRRVIDSFDAVRRPSSRNLDAALLDSIVAEQLHQLSIDIPHTPAILLGDSILVASDRSDSAAFLAAAFKVPLGPQLPFGESEVLAVSFPSAGTYVLEEMQTDLALSLALIGLIVWAFVYSVRSLVRQHEFAGRLTDFINNMTHEFKTPVSTIGLASEALARPDVIRSAKKVRTYNAVIRDENLRMRSQIDRILQMATLEEGEVDFRKEPLSLHSLIGRVIEATRVQVTARGGSLRSSFEAPKDTIVGDQLHIEGIFHNVLDNAVKYSPEPPVVTVSSRTDAGMICIRISDKGIGVSPEHLGSVFDTFYRVPTGNVHDVKGFGLGLSYVKLVAEKHGGSVRMESERDAGTTVEIRLPLRDEA